MQSPIEELTKQILILQSKLDPQSKQYTQLTAKLVNYILGWIERMELIFYFAY